MKRRKSDSVFDVYAHEYDLLTDAAAREANHDREVAAMIERFRPGAVLDAGCATGLTTMLFSRQGVRATGLDRSRRMLAEATKKYGRLGLPVAFRYGQFEKLPGVMDGAFDLVVCLANSITGVETLSRLRLALRNFYGVLKPGGALVLQLLNYLAVAEQRLSPIKATVNGGIIYERFSERRGRRYCLYVTRLDTGSRPFTFEVFRHEFDSFTDKEIMGAVRVAGFTKIERYSDLFMTRKFVRSAHDLVVVCRKSL